MSDGTVRPATATPLVRAQDLHGEVLDPSTGNVWQSLEPITHEAYQALPLEPGWRRVGIGRAAMNEHWFTRSPGREQDGPMQLLEIGGRRFGLCARPASAQSQPVGSDGPRMLLVDKHHVVRFVGARQVPVLEDSFKIAAMPNTFSFPTQPMLSLYAGPRVWVALVLALIAALVHLAALGFAGA